MHKYLIAFAILVLPPVARADEQISSTEFRKTAIAEWQKLEKHYTYLQVSSVAKRSDTSQEISYAFRKSGLFYSIRSGNGDSNGFQVVHGRNSGYAFKLRSKSKAEAALAWEISDVGKHINPHIDGVYRSSMSYLLDAPLAIHGCLPLHKIIGDEHFKLTSVEKRPDGLVKILFSYTPDTDLIKQMYPLGSVVSFSISGEVVVDADNFYVIREYRLKGKSPTNSPNTREFTGSIDYGSFAAGGEQIPYPTRHVIKEPGLTREFMTKEWEVKEFPESIFTLSEYGLPEILEHRPSGYRLWILSGGFVLICSCVYFCIIKGRQ